MSKAKHRVKFSLFDLFGAMPIVVEAIQGVIEEVDTARSPDSPGGSKITPEEGLEIAREIHARLFPLAEYVVTKLR